MKITNKTIPHLFTIIPLVGVAHFSAAQSELTNSGFEADEPAAIGHSALVPALWIGLGTGVKYAAKTTLLGADNKAPSGGR